MPKKYWDAQKLNEELRKIDMAGYQLPTKLYRVQSGLTRVVISNELKNAGYIRTYEESVEYQRRYYGEKFEGYSEKQYIEDIKQLQNVLGSERSYQGEVRAQRGRLLDIVSDMNEAMNTNVDVSKLTTKELYDAVKQASQMLKDTNSGSPMFYEYLADILEGYSSSV